MFPLAILLAILFSNQQSNAYRIQKSCTEVFHSFKSLEMKNQQLKDSVLPVPGMKMNFNWLAKTASATASLAILFQFPSFPSLADETNSIPPTDTVAVTISTPGVIKKIPLYTKKTSALQQYVDISRGFKLQRPFGYNEFDGAGGGYLVKFASLTDVDENVVVGATPATSGKISIVDYGSLDSISQKLLKKRVGGTVLSAEARETENIVFYSFKFENPLDTSLPRIGPLNRKATKQIELYQLCVAKGKLWSVQATSNDQLFPGHEEAYTNSLLSFVPKL